jgi:8-oxo-dGTP pyrophosphatase MutT (NUDIX family)
MTNDSRHSVSVAGVIVDNQGRALLIQRRDNGHWEPPGGVLEHGETIEEALRREVREETGLEINPGPLSGIYQNMPRHIVALVFRCTVAAGLPRENDEVKAFCWATQQRVAELMVEAYAARVLDVLLNHGAVALRPHDGTHLLRS